MELELAITSYQRLSPTVASSKQLSSTRKYILGRSTDCDWHLPDPDRVISSRHAEIHFADGQFRLRDISTNGVFVNGAVEPLGQGVEVVLSDGDSLRFGDYELRVSLVAAGDTPAVRQEPQSGFASGIPSDPVAPSRPSAPSPMPLVGSVPGDVPVQESRGGNPTLASGLKDQRLGDSHVDIPDIAIPNTWQWDTDGDQAAATTSPPATATATTKPGARAPSPSAGGDPLTALFQGLGMPQLAEKGVSADTMRDLGDLTRILLDRLLELLRARAEQKQKLRVQQTLFQRSENNPLKFSATAQDAVDALLVRRHSSFLGPRAAVEAAFSDVLAHERALMAGVESVVAELLQTEDDSTVPSAMERLPVIRKARAYDALMQKRALQQEEFGDSNRMLRSDAFVEAYESAARESEQE